MRRSILLLVLLLGGCKAGTVGGLSLSLGAPWKASVSDYERGLWFDHDRRAHQPEGIDLKIDLVAGHMIRPVPKFWQASNNPWGGGGPWFVIRSPMIGPYISLAFGHLGAYCGFKTFQVTDEHRSLDRYGKWMRQSEFPQPDLACRQTGSVNVYLQPSASLRRTRWK